MIALAGLALRTEEYGDPPGADCAGYDFMENLVKYLSNSSLFPQYEPNETVERL